MATNDRTATGSSPCECGCGHVCDGQCAHTMSKCADCGAWVTPSHHRCPAAPQQAPNTLGAEFVRLAERASPGEWRVATTGYSVRSSAPRFPHRTDIVCTANRGLDHDTELFQVWLDDADFLAFLGTHRDDIAKALAALPSQPSPAAPDSH